MNSWGQRFETALRRRNVPKLYVLALEVGVDQSAISRWKQGKSISMVNAVRLCEELDVSLDWLMMGRGTIDLHRPEAPDQVWKDVDDFIANLSPEMVEKLNAMLEASYHKVRQRFANRMG